MCEVAMICKENLDMVKQWTSKLCDNMEMLSAIMGCGTSFICSNNMTDQQIKAAKELIDASQLIVEQLSTDAAVNQFPANEAEGFKEGLNDIGNALVRYNKMLEQHVSNLWLDKIMEVCC